MKLSSLVFLFLCLGIVSCNSNRNTAQTDCLKNAAYKIETLDMQEDDSDLLFLKKILADDSVKIVFLGEQSHFDGTTFRGKARLVKFLHDKCGFDVLAFESGFYDCAKGWELARQYNDYEIGIKGSIFGLWSYANEFQPLTEYLNSTLKSSNPVILAGVDNAMSGSFSTDFFAADLEKLNILNKESEESRQLLSIVWSQMPNPFGPSRPDSARIESDVRFLEVLLSRLDTLKSTGTSEIDREFWIHVVTGLKTKLISLLFDYNSVVKDNQAPPSNNRDAQMAGNLIWLLENKYPGKKIIIWTANFHGSRGFSNIRFGREYFGSVMKKTRTMGDSLFETYGKKVYTISFTCFESDFTSIATDSTLEYSFKQAGYKYAFLNLRNTESTKCFGSSYITNILMSEGKADWKRVTDGLFFIKGIRKSKIDN